MMGKEEGLEIFCHLALSLKSRGRFFTFLFSEFFSFFFFKKQVLSCVPIDRFYPSFGFYSCILKSSLSFILSPLS